jgi:hypothetical protein
VLIHKFNVPQKRNTYVLHTGEQDVIAEQSTAAQCLLGRTLKRAGRKAKQLWLELQGDGSRPLLQLCLQTPLAAPPKLELHFDNCVKLWHTQTIDGQVSLLVHVSSIDAISCYKWYLLTIVCRFTSLYSAKLQVARFDSCMKPVYRIYCIKGGHDVSQRSLQLYSNLTNLFDLIV